MHEKSWLQEDVGSSSRSGPLLLPGRPSVDRRRHHRRHHLVPGRLQLGVSERRLPRQPGSALPPAISQVIFIVTDIFSTG